MNDVVIEARDLSVTYNDDDGVVEALKDFTLRVRAGEAACVVGQSGCGKTTLLKALSAIVIPTGGGVYFHSSELRRPSHRIGMLFQESTLFPWLSVRDNVMFPLRMLGGLSAEQSASRRDSLLSLVGMIQYSEFRTSSLSAGMKQRVSLARALAVSPEVLLLDEPFAALDTFSKMFLYPVFLNIIRSNAIATVFVTHDLDEAIAIADQVLIMAGGKLVHESLVTLPEPRVSNGVRCIGFEQVRNELIERASNAFRSPGSVN